jgi:hypothetical protein
LLTNIKRWNKISNKFHFGNGEKYKCVNIIFDAYCCIKRKSDIKLYPIIELFFNVENIVYGDYAQLIILSLELGQNKMLDSIIKIIGDKKTFKTIDDFYPNLTDNVDRNTSGIKLCKRYNKIHC